MIIVIRIQEYPNQTSKSVRMYGAHQVFPGFSDLKYSKAPLAFPCFICFEPYYTVLYSEKKKIFLGGLYQITCMTTLHFYLHITVVNHDRTICDLY